MLLATQILNVLSLLTAAGPVVVGFASECKKLWAMMFAGGLISIEKQAELNAWSENEEAKALAGQIPDALKVDPDPVFCVRTKQNQSKLVAAVKLQAQIVDELIPDLPPV